MNNLREFVNKVSILQSQFAELYDNHEELVAINPDYIQVSVKTISDLVFEYSLPWKLEQIDKLTESYPWHVEVEVDGVKFTAVGTTKRMTECGFLGGRMKSRADIPITRDTVLQFGKHKGWTIGECVECDPSYVIWLSEDEVMKIPDDILEEAQENWDTDQMEQEDDVDEWGFSNPHFWGLDFGDDD